MELEDVKPAYVILGVLADMKEKQFCEKHSRELVFFCKEHSAEICMMCWQTEHRGTGHTVEPYEDIVREKFHSKWTDLEKKVGEAFQLDDMIQHFC